MPASIFRVIMPVADIEEARVFYSQLLEQPGEAVSPGRRYFKCGAVVLACYDPRADGDHRVPDPNPNHVYFAVDGLEAYYARAQTTGATLLTAIELQAWGERSFYCEDVFGNKLCFVDETTVFTGGGFFE